LKEHTVHMRLPTKELLWKFMEIAVAEMLTSCLVTDPELFLEHKLWPLHTGLLLNLHLDDYIDPRGSVLLTLLECSRQGKIVTPLPLPSPWVSRTEHVPRRELFPVGTIYSLSWFPNTIAFARWLPKSEVATVMKK
jgi:hypothetical protein